MGCKESNQTNKTTKAGVVGTQKNCLNEMVLLNTQNVRFHPKRVFRVMYTEIIENFC